MNLPFDLSTIRKSAQGISSGITQVEHNCESAQKSLALEVIYGRLCQPLPRRSDFEAPSARYPSTQTARLAQIMLPLLSKKKCCRILGHLSLTKSVPLEPPAISSSLCLLVVRTRIYTEGQPSGKQGISRSDHIRKSSHGGYDRGRKMEQRRSSRSA